MVFENIIYEMVIIFAGAALFATLFLYLKQPIILAYILFGVAVGPWGLNLINNADHIEKLSHFGIILLLFLIGLSLQPDRLLLLFGKTAVVALVSSFAFLSLGMSVCLLFGFSLTESLIVGAALMFSSTIISLKLIPTTTLHHKHTGDLMISVLLMQDIFAIVLILLLTGGDAENVSLTIGLLLLKLVFLVVLSFILVNKVISRLFLRFDSIREYSFLLTLGWGLMGAGLASQLGLSYEIGAFIAGVSLASFPVALAIAEDLKPLRDFFLILFFFSIGAGFDLLMTQDVLLVGVILSVVMIIAKPVVFSWSFRAIGEKRNLANELGVRLGQASEFSLLVAYSALVSGHIESRASYLVQTVVVLTFIISTYWVVFRYPTPIASSNKQLQD